MKRATTLSAVGLTLAALLLTACSPAAKAPDDGAEAPPTQQTPSQPQAAPPPWGGLSFDVEVESGATVVSSAGVVSPTASFEVVDGNPNLVLEYALNAETKRNFLNFDTSTQSPFDFDYRGGSGPKADAPLVTQFMLGYLIGNADGTGSFEPYTGFSETEACPAEAVPGPRPLTDVLRGSDGKITSFKLRFLHLNDVSSMLGEAPCSAYIAAEFPMKFTHK